jgi:23S rRNA pseudouridine1911/1915/1917 synthase
MSEDQISEFVDESDDYRPLGSGIGANHVGLRIDEFLARNYPFLSRNQWKYRLESGQLTVNSQTVKSAYRLRFADQLAFFHPPASEPEVNRDIRMIWRQGGVMAIYKPANLPMHENGRYRKNTFAAVLMEQFGPEWAAVHRLDKETSGIVICAGTNPLRSRLSELLRGRDVFKRYEALAFGTPDDDDWIEEGPIGDLRDSEIRIKKWVVEGGLPAETRFRVLGRKDGRCWIEAVPKTGRTNQIRIHLAHAGYPIIGDKLYNPDENVFLQYWQHGNSLEVQKLAGFERLCLHAAEISFVHPELAHRVWVQAELPEELKNHWHDPDQWLDSSRGIIRQPTESGTVFA